MIAIGLVSKENLASLDTSVSRKQVSFARVYSSDTTIREVVENNSELWRLYRDSDEKSDRAFQLWDCTVHPPKDITGWPIEDFPDLSGPKSKTLHDAGAFPSAIWMVLPHGIPPNKFASSDYEDSQYNTYSKVESDGVGGTVEFMDPSLSGSGSSKPLPSQVIESVKRRFDGDKREAAESLQKAKVAQVQNKENERKRRRDRADKLDQRIKKLEDSSSNKNKKVSDQVRKMLVKSRATGDKRLKQQDRLYFECILDNGDEMKREFRFFSPQDTFARIADSFPKPTKTQGGNDMEVIMKHSLDGEADAEYRRFPMTMRVYEAIANKFINENTVDVLLIRWFADTADMTPSILDTKEDESIEDKPTQAMGPSVETSSQKEENIVKPGPGDVDEVLTEIIQQMDLSKNKGKKPKKVTPSIIKVRNMQIKSKAKGDAKRVPKVENRFFLDVVVVEMETKTASSSFQFLARTDPIERILQSVLPASKAEDCEFLALSKSEASAYKPFQDTSLSLDDAEKQGLLNSFDRLIVKRK